MKTIIDPDLERYARDHSSAEPELLRELIATAQRELSAPQMISEHLQGRFLAMLVRLTGARRILEIGTYAGYSALCMAEALPADGELITCDIDEQAVAFARRFIARSPHGGKITVRVGPALDTIRALSGAFDLVFIDADKENYVNYYRAVFDLVRPGGLIVVDNVLWDGRVLAPKAESDRVIDQLNQLITADARVDHVLVTIRDGVQLVRKR
jgi:caffeoyl-CoA O-methyltransferase